MSNDLIQYLICEAGDLLDRSAFGAGTDRIAEAQELMLLAQGLIDRREMAAASFEYREAA